MFIWPGSIRNTAARRILLVAMLPVLIAGALGHCAYRLAVGLFVGVLYLAVEAYEGVVLTILAAASIRQRWNRPYQGPHAHRLIVITDEAEYQASVNPDGAEEILRKGPAYRPAGDP